jgi:hypothetical protein
MSKKVSAISSGTPTTDDKILMVDATTDALYLATIVSILSDLVLTKLATGFSIAGGTTPKTLTVDADATISTIQSDISTAQGAITTLQGNRVQTTGDETIAGVKTFSSFPITPSSAPTTDYQVANKKYADDLVFAGVPDAAEATKGKAAIATAAEANAGTDDTKMMTAKKVKDSTAIPAGVATALGNKIETSYLDTDGTLAANSDSKIATQKAVKTYAAAKASINYTAGDILIISADTERSKSNDTNYTKVKEITLARAGTLRVKFDGQYNNHTAYARVYKNGSAVGTERTLTSSYVTYSEDLTDFAIGDKIQLYYKTGGIAGDSVSVKNFRLYEGSILMPTVNTN